MSFIDSGKLSTIISSKSIVSIFFLLVALLNVYGGLHVFYFLLHIFMFFFLQ